MSAYSSVGKYDVSVIDLSVGGRGAAIIRNDGHSTSPRSHCGHSNLFNRLPMSNHTLFVRFEHVIGRPTVA